MAKLPELTKIYISAYSDQAIQLGDAVPGFAGVEQLEDGGQYSCVVKNGVQTEKFIGTYSAASQSLTRQTQNVYPAGADKISLAADGLFVDFVLLARDLPNDDNLKATLQSKGGASFVQSTDGSVETRLSKLDTEILDKVSGTLGANTQDDDGLIQGLVYVKKDNSLKATYKDSTGTHTVDVQKTEVLDELGEETDKAISQRAATDAIKNIDLSGYALKSDVPELLNGTGDSDSSGMTQNAITTAINNVKSGLSDYVKFEDIIDNQGYNKDKAISQNAATILLDDKISGSLNRDVSKNDGAIQGMHFNTPAESINVLFKDTDSDDLKQTYAMTGVFTKGNSNIIVTGMYFLENELHVRIFDSTDSQNPKYSDLVVQTK